MPIHSSLEQCNTTCTCIHWMDYARSTLIGGLYLHHELSSVQMPFLEMFPTASPNYGVSNVMELI